MKKFASMVLSGNYLANYLQRKCLPPAQPWYDKLSGKLFATDLFATAQPRYDKLSGKLLATELFATAQPRNDKLSGKLFATELFTTRATTVRQIIWQTICNGIVCHPHTDGMTNYLANYLTGIVSDTAMPHTSSYIAQPLHTPV